MDVAHKFQEVGLFFAEDGFIAIFEEVAGSLMAFIKGDCVSREESSHDAPDPFGSASYKQMDVISHERPRVNDRLVFSY